MVACVAFAEVLPGAPAWAVQDVCGGCGSLAGPPLLNGGVHEQGKWASHVSYSNDVMLVDEKTNSPVEYMGGKPVAELPDTAPY